MSDSCDFETFRRLVAERRSVRRFRPDPVAHELVEKVLDVARHAPSAGNSQPWEFVVVEDVEMRRRIARAAASLFAASRKREPSFNWSISVCSRFLRRPPFSSSCSVTGA